MPNPFDARSLARSAAQNTHGQRRECEHHRTVKLDPHLQDGQLNSFFDITEKLLPQEFESTPPQVQRLAIAIRTVLITKRRVPKLHSSLVALHC